MLIWSTICINGPLAQLVERRANNTKGPFTLTRIRSNPYTF